MALKKTQTQQTTKNESTQKQEDDLKERVVTTLSSNKEIELIAK